MLWLGLSALGVVFLVAAWLSKGHGYDLWAFWAVDPAHPYAVTDNLSGQGVFRYAPPFALAFAPLGLLPLPVVQAGWMALQLVALRYVAGRWFLAVILFPPVWADLVYGNVNIFLGAMIVAGFRWPGAWVFALLSKVTPGIGVLWFLGRREWRSLAIASLTTAGIVAASVVLQGAGVWGDWLGVLSASNGQAIPFDALPVPLLWRLPIAASLVLWGGYTNRRWTVPIAVVLAMPTLWVISFAPLIALRSHVAPEEQVGVRTRVLDGVEDRGVAR